MSQLSQESIAALLTHYGFDLGGSQVETVVVTWLQKYDPQWIVWAIVEALDRGRYKTISVDRILEIWERRGSPNYYFSGDYERRILSNIPSMDAEKSSPAPVEQKESNPTSTPPIERRRHCLFRFDREFDPEVVPPAMLNHHQSVEQWEFAGEETIYNPPTPQNVASNDDSLPDSASLVDPSAPPIEPKPHEKIPFNAEPSPFFHRLKDIAGGAEAGN